MKWKWFLIAAIAVVVVGVVWFRGAEARRARIFAMTDCGDPPPEWVGTKWGFVDRQGREVIPLQYDMAWGFHDGIARVAFMEEYGPGRLRHPWVQSSGFIDKTGKFVIPMTDGFYGEFHDGLATAYVKGDPPGESSTDRKYGYIDKTGQFAIEPQYGYVSDFSEGLASFAMGDSYYTKSGLIDTKGRMVLEPIYYGIEEFSEGRAIVNLAEDTGCEGPYGYIDRTGKLITAEKFYSAEKFKDGVAVVQLEKDKISVTAYVDKDGMIVPRPNGRVLRTTWHSDAVYVGPRTKVIDGGTPGKTRGGQSLQKYDFINPNGDEQDWILVRAREGLAYTQNLYTGKYGFMDTNGKTIIEPRFDRVRDFNNGFAAVRIGKGWGAIDKTGKLVVKPKYAWVSDFSEGFAAVCTGKDALREPPIGY